MSLRQKCLKVWRKIPEHHQTKARFFVVGIFNTAWSLSIYPVLYFLAAPLKLHYLSILLFSYIVNMTVAFITNKYLVFKTSGNHLQEYGKFAVLQVLCFVVNLAALPALVELAGMKPVLAQTLFAILVIISSYFWHSRITFSSTKVTN